MKGPYAYAVCGDCAMQPAGPALGWYPWLPCGSIPRPVRAMHARAAHHVRVLPCPWAHSPERRVPPLSPIAPCPCPLLCHAQSHRFTYNEPMPIESCTQSLCDLALRFGEDSDEGGGMVGGTCSGGAAAAVAAA